MEGAEVLTRFTADTSEVESASEQTSKMFDKVKLAGIAAFTAMTAAVDKFAIGLLKSGVQYNAEIETYMTRLTTLTKSASEAESIMEQIKKDALATPFDVASLVDGEASLMSTGMTAEEARKDILALGNAISGVGKGNAEFKRMVNNLQGIKTNTVATTQDLRQFNNVGIPIYKLLAEYLGITQEEVMKTKISYDMLSGALANASAEGGLYYNAMVSQSQTYNGAMSNLTESFNVFKGALAEGVFQALEGLIPKLTAMFDWLTKNKDTIIAIAIPLMTFLNIMLGLLAIKGVITTFSLLWVTLTANPITMIISLIGALIAAFTYLWNNCEEFKNFWIGLWNGIKNVVSVVVGNVVNFVSNIVSSVKKAIDFLGSLKDKIVSAFKSAGSKIKDIGSDMVKGLWDGLKGMKDWVINKVKDMGKSILNGLKKVLGIKSPSKEFAIVGKYSVLGYTEALDDMSNFVDKQVEDTFTPRINPNINPINSATVGSMLASTPQSNITIYNELEIDPLGQLVNNVKTFSGGAKNDYNYVGGY